MTTAQTLESKFYIAHNVSDVDVFYTISLKPEFYDGSDYVFSASVANAHSPEMAIEIMVAMDAFYAAEHQPEILRSMVNHAFEVQQTAKDALKLHYSARRNYRNAGTDPRVWSAEEQTLAEYCTHCEIAHNRLVDLWVKTL